MSGPDLSPSTTALLAQSFAAPGKQQALYKWLEELDVPEDVGPGETERVHWMSERLFMSRAWDDLVSHEWHQNAINKFGDDAYYQARAAVINQEDRAAVDLGKLFD